MKLRLIPVLVLISASAGAQAKEACSPASADYCVPVVGCLLDSSDYFLGKVFGRREGPLQVSSAQGVTCEGYWRRTMIGTAKGEFQCEDGRTGNFTFAYQDPDTGTGRGRGRIDGSGAVIFWAGTNLMGYFQTEDSKFPELMACAKDALATAGTLEIN